MFSDTAVRASARHRLQILFSFLLLALPAILHAQSNPVTFEHFSIDQGMSANTVTCVYQDSIGYLWFGTYSGLDKFDGYNFKSYKHDPGDLSSIARAQVKALYEDRQDNLWVGTSRGLDRLDRAAGTFAHFTPHPPGPGTEWSNHVFAIQEDQFGILWVGTGEGLDVFDSATGTFTYLRHDSMDAGSLSDDFIGAIHEDKAGSLWIGTGGGLDKLDRETGKFIHYLHNEYWINSIHEDKTGILWMGTNNGVVEFDQTAGSFTQYRHDPKDPRSLSSNNVSSICGDEEGGLWIGTYDRGLNAFDTRSRKVTHYVHDEKDPGSLNSNFIAAVYRERSGTLWILSANQGVNKLNRPKPLFTKYPYEAQAPLGFLRGVFEGTDGKIWIRKSKGWEKFDPKTETFVRMPLDQDLYPFAEDREGNLWIGPRSGGLCKRDQHGHLTSFHDSSGREFRQLVNCFSEGQGGRFWIGTLDGDVFAVDPAAHTVTLVQQGNIQVNAIREDRFGLVWVGTWEGLLCYDRMRDTVVRYTSDPRNLSSLGSSTILSIYEDRAGTMWFGAGGLNRYDRATGTFTRFAEKDGLSHYAVFEILEDDHGNLWLSTLKGLSKFCAACASLPAGRHGASGGDLKNNRFKNYDAYGGDGFRASNGEMFLGSSKGLTRFHPDSIRDNPFVPPIVLTTFRKFEQPFPFGKEIRLPYTENFISFEFAALSYVSPERNQYAYKMEGIDANWVNSGTRRYAGYPHLDPGEYVFRVKGSNNDGVWNEEGTSIAVIITPPFWATLWFRGFVFIAVLVSVGGSIRYVEMRKLKRRIERLEQERAVERERARISQDMHDEVGAGLTEIGILSELAKKYIQNPGQAEIHMQRVSQTS